VRIKGVEADSPAKTVAENHVGPSRRTRTLPLTFRLVNDEMTGLRYISDGKTLPTLFISSIYTDRIFRSLEKGASAKSFFRIPMGQAIPGACNS